MSATVRHLKPGHRLEARVSTVLTTRRLKAEVAELNASGFAAGLIACHDNQSYYLKLVPVADGSWLHAEALLVHTRPGQPKTLKSAQAVINFASRYGIEARRIRIQEGRP